MYNVHVAKSFDLLNYNSHLFMTTNTATAMHRTRQSIPTVTPAIKPAFDLGSAENKKRRNKTKSAKI